MVMGGGEEHGRPSQARMRAKSTDGAAQEVSEDEQGRIL